MLAKPSQHVPIYLEYFPSYMMLKCKNSYFYHIFFVSLLGTPCDNNVKCYIDEKVNWERTDTE